MAVSSRQLQRRAAKLAAARSTLYAEPTAADGRNVTYTDATGTVHRLRIPFSRYEDGRAMEDAGFRAGVNATAEWPDALGLTLALGQQLYHLAYAETYRIDRLARDPGTAHQRLTLRRINGAAA